MDSSSHEGELRLPPIPDDVPIEARNRRDWLVYQARVDGKTYKEIAEKFELSRERAKQIVAEQRHQVERRRAASVVDPMILSDRLDDLGLSYRTTNALRNRGIETLPQLLACPSQKMLMDTPGFGVGAYKELMDFLEARGLTFAWSSLDI